MFCLPGDRRSAEATQGYNTQAAVNEHQIVLADDHGGGLYRKRKAMVEPVFAQTKHNRRINQFHRRGRSAARSEWRLITATHIT
jgi:hypothetical protein